MTDFVNSLHTLLFSFRTISANGDTDVDSDTIGAFREGFTVFWRKESFTDGDYAISVLESLDGGSTKTPIDPRKLMTPTFLFSQQPTVDPFTQDSASGSKSFGIKEFNGNFITLRVTATNVTVGSNIMIVLIGHTQLSPVNPNHIN